MHYGLKVGLYVLTTVGMFFFAWRENTLKNELTEGFSKHNGVADWEVRTTFVRAVQSPAVP